MKNLTFSLLTLVSFFSFSQSVDLQPRTVDYYLNQQAELEIAAYFEEGFLLDSNTLAPQYLDTATGQCNMDGYMKAMEIRMITMQNFYDGYLFMQKLDYEEDIYVLYFSLVGFDDMEWSIFKWEKDSWKNEEKLKSDRIGSDTTVSRILWNYDEATKNLENIRIFIINDYLIMERGNLYHSLYDLRSEKVILNEESPWAASDLAEGEGLRDWIRVNLNDKIEKLVQDRAEDK
ncbi:MAG: hypothetical protein P8P74_08505 [Crocinitomicaceae bacterium]|nr:hypothetical protein [Crocinitomicaceae bacterium]